MKKAIRNLENSEIKKLVNFGISYPPKVRALLGAVLEDSNECKDLNVLKKSINTTSRYLYGINEKLLWTVNYWNIS